MIYLTDKLAVTADSECYMVGRPVETVQESGGKRCKAPKLRSPRYYHQLLTSSKGLLPHTYGGNLTRMLVRQKVKFAPLPQ